MSFPISPSDGQRYTTSLGTVYEYVASDDKWVLATAEIGVTGAQGFTGLQGATGLDGAQGIQGDTGIQGAQGDTGAQGETGVEGAQGDTGAQGETGAQGLTGAGTAGAQGETGVDGSAGAQGETGLQGETGPQGSSFGIYDAGTLTSSHKEIDWSDGIKQELTVANTGESGIIYMSGADAGSNMTLKIDYDVTQVPAYFTGVMWVNGADPLMSGETGSIDIVNVFYDGTNYYGQASTGHKY